MLFFYIFNILFITPVRSRDMRSLPPPRYSRFRTIRRIWRSIITFFSTGYMSDSAAFAGRSMPSNKRQSPTRIRRSRVTRRPTSRTTLVNRVSQTLLNELIDEDQIISEIVRRDRKFNKGAKLSDWFGLFHLWKRSSDALAKADDKLIRWSKTIQLFTTTNHWLKNPLYPYSLWQKKKYPIYKIGENN